MNQVQVRIDGETALEPGSSISGTASWSLSEAPESIHVRLLWYTEGRGDRDMSVIDETSLGTTSLSGELPFNFNLPEGPYSFSGHLISLIWAVEAVVEPSEATGKVELTVGPDGRQAVIGTPSEEDTKAS